MRASLCHFELFSRLGLANTRRARHGEHLELTKAQRPQYLPLTPSSAHPRDLPSAARLLDRLCRSAPDRASEILAQLGSRRLPGLDRIPAPGSDALDPRTAVRRDRLANHVEMRIKQRSLPAPARIFAAGPADDPDPFHGTLPSGHATESFAAAFVLWAARPGSAPNPMRVRSGASSSWGWPRASPSIAPSPACTSRSTAPRAPSSA